MTGNLLRDPCQCEASSQEWTLTNRLQAKYATDGSRGTRWASKWGAGTQWLRVDVGAGTEVGRVTVDWEAAYATRYQVQVSDDATHWTTVWQTGAGNGGIDTAVFEPVRTRWVRVLATERGTRYGYSIHELGVHRR